LYGTEAVLVSRAFTVTFIAAGTGMRWKMYGKGERRET